MCRCLPLSPRHAALVLGHHLLRFLDMALNYLRRSSVVVMADKVKSSDGAYGLAAVRGLMISASEALPSSSYCATWLRNRNITAEIQT